MADEEGDSTVKMDGGLHVQNDTQDNCLVLVLQQYLLWKIAAQSRVPSIILIVTFCEKLLNNCMHTVSYIFALILIATKIWPPMLKKHANQFVISV